jgi:cold shock CspA family protein
MVYKLRTFTGTVVRFWRNNGYGYVRMDAAPRREAHFHMRDCEDLGADQIREGTRLQFYLAQGAKGLNAIRCSKLNEGVSCVGQ